MLSPLPSLSRRARGGLEPPGRTTLSLSLSLVLETTVFVKTLREETPFYTKRNGGSLSLLPSLNQLCDSQSVTLRVTGTFGVLNPPDDSLGCHDTHDPPGC